jgi:hypothetical protein
VERFDPEGNKSPEGEWILEEKPGMLDRRQATGLSDEAVRRDSKPQRDGGAKGRTGRMQVQQGIEGAGRKR